MVSGLPYLPPPPALAGKPNKPRFPPTQAAPSPPLSNTTSTVRGASTRLGSEGTDANEAATKLAEAIDDFLGDLEKKFKGISDEILTKLDDMAERCDRLEQEMLLKDAMIMEKNSAGSATGSL